MRRVAHSGDELRRLQAAGGADSLHDRLGEWTGFGGAFGEDGIEVSGIGGEGGTAFAGWAKVFPEGIEQLLFIVAVAVPPGAEAGFHGGDFGLGGDEFVELHDAGGIGVFGIVDADRVGFDTHDFFSKRFFFFEERDRIVVTFAHFLSIEARHGGTGFADHGFGQFEQVLTVAGIKFRGDVAGHFQMLFLILADGHDVAVVDEDVGGHQHWVGEKTGAGDETAGGFVFEGMSIFQHRDRSDAAEQPRQFGDFRNVALAKKGRSSRVQAAGEKVERQFAAMVAEDDRVVNGGQSVIVSNKIKGFAFMLQANGGLHHAEIISKVGAACWLDARENAHDR